MPKTTPAPELDAIVQAVAKHPSGIGSAGLADVLPAGSMRTLQRRLAALVRSGRLVIEGEGPATKYKLRGITGALDASLDELTGAATGETYVPVSLEGEAIRKYVRRALHQRRPVSYDIAFLEAYEPNRTHYLSEPLRVQLHALGRSNVDPGAAAGTFARDVLQRLLIDLSWASSRLEGNTYSRLDTQRLIEHGHTAEGKDAIETQMILNHKAAIDYLVHDPGIAVDTRTVTALHALLSDGLLRDADAGGRVRRRAVDITGTVYRPIVLPQRLDELFDIVMRAAAEVDDPLEQAFFLMVHLPYLQPFEDVNKRTSRLAANIPLMRANLAPLSFVEVPRQAYIDGVLGVYETTRVDLLRDVFVWAYERSCQQYTAVKQQLVPPDLFRLRHRAQLTEAVRAIVLGGSRLDDRVLKRAIPADIAREHRTRFATLLRSEFATLHAGNAVRFGLRPLEFQAWEEVNAAPTLQPNTAGPAPSPRRRRR